MDNIDNLCDLGEYKLKLGLVADAVRDLSLAASRAPERQRIIDKLNHCLVKWIDQATAFDMVARNPFNKIPAIQVHPTNICNAKCCFCVSSKCTDRQMVMQTELCIDATTQFVALGGQRLYLTPNNGEPLVDPDLRQKLEGARHVGISYIGMTTNGILMHRGDTVYHLLENCDNIGISLPGLDKENYRRIYGVDRASDVFAGIDKLAKAKRNLDSNTEIMLFFRIDRPIRDVLMDPGMDLIIDYVRDGTIVFDDDVLIEVDDWGGEISPERLPGMMKIKPARTRKKALICRRLLNDLAVLPDGSVRICACRYFQTNLDELVIGNLNEQTLSEIIAGPAHKSLIYNVIKGNWPPVCQSCNWYTAVAGE